MRCYEQPAITAITPVMAAPITLSGDNLVRVPVLVILDGSERPRPRVRGFASAIENVVVVCHERLPVRDWVGPIELELFGGGIRPARVASSIGPSRHALLAGARWPPRDSLRAQLGNRAFCEVVSC